jgi:protein-tyrosine phosphatase
MTVSPPLSTDAPANLRDVRGLRTDDGRIVRRGALYRSEALRVAAAPGMPVWPPAVVVDLRAPDEAFAAHPLRDVAEVHNIPLGRSLAPALAEQTDDPDLVWAYRFLAVDAADEIARIVEIVARSQGPALVHCTAGKDRTGIVVAVLLRAVGVRRADVLADYLRTGENLEPLWAALTAAGVPEPHNRALLGVQASALEAVLDEVEAHEGGVAGWLLARGVARRDLELLEERLLG